MADKSVTASEFARNFGRYRDEAAAGDVVEVTIRGRVVGGFISARQLEEYRALKRRERQAYTIDTLPDDLAEELEQGLRDEPYGE